MDFDIFGDVFLKNVYAVFRDRSVTDRRFGTSRILDGVLFLVRLDLLSLLSRLS
jgi:hypothetical protein